MTAVYSDFYWPLCFELQVKSLHAKHFPAVQVHALYIQLHHE